MSPDFIQISKLNRNFNQLVVYSMSLFTSEITANEIELTVIRLSKYHLSAVKTCPSVSPCDCNVFFIRKSPQNSLFCLNAKVLTWHRKKALSSIKPFMRRPIKDRFALNSMPMLAGTYKKRKNKHPNGCVMKLHWKIVSASASPNPIDTEWEIIYAMSNESKSFSWHTHTHRKKASGMRKWEKKFNRNVQPMKNHSSRKKRNIVQTQ